VSECWAKCLGDCKGKITAEHIVTEGLWTSNEVGVFGLPWCREKHVFIGVKNLTKNMLCDRHNSTLSPVDEGGITAFDTFRQTSKVHVQRYANIESGFRTGRLDVYTYTFNGPLFERWLLKTMINMEMAGDQNLPVGPYFNQPQPACDLVETTYGKRNLSGNAGLYFAATLGQRVKMEERLQYVSMVGSSPNGNYVAGGGFVFFGFRFMLLLDPSAKPETFKEHNQATGTSTEIPLIKHPYKLLFTVNEEPSQEIEITW
jgi:hypothetical protein